MSAAPSDSTGHDGQHPGGHPGNAVGIKETIVSLIIAFTLAFVFRGYVVEPYVIPTGSMAPTLLGAHTRVIDPANGNDWPITPWFESRQDAGNPEPLPQQGGRLGGFDMGAFDPIDPMTKEPVTVTGGTKLLSGDRIFVLRYVWPIFKPTRFDVIVFKDPQDPARNFIKRLIGLPGEQVALIDGDVFVRSIDEKNPSPVGTVTWSLPGWKIARKDERTQRTAWQTIFDSRYAPEATQSGKPFVGPWIAPATGGWEIEGKTAYHYSGSGPSTLNWNIKPDTELDYAQLFAPEAQARAARDKFRRSWHLTDSYPFNEVFPNTRERNSSGQVVYYPVSDLKLAAGIAPEAASQEFAAVIRAREHEFRGRLSPRSTGGYEAIVEMRPVVQPPAAWKELDRRPIQGVMEVGKVTNVEFWHADQRLQMYVEGVLAASGEYEWTPEERVQHVFGKTLADILAADAQGLQQGKMSLIGFGGAYSRPEPWFEVSGPCTMHRVAIARDLFYQPVMAGQTNNGVFSRPAAAAYPSPTTDKLLTHEQYFVCGDNSPLSADARAWNSVDPWVASLIDPTPGVVPEKLLIGKAFLVYFPAIHQQQVLGAKVPVPNAGEVRWIW